MKAQKINSTFSNPGDLTEFGDKLYFSAYDDTYGYELWQVDSTGTATVQDLFLGTYNYPDSYFYDTFPNSSFPDDFTKFGDKLYFSANDGTHGYELWQVDSTGQASLVQDINPGLGGSSLFGDFTKFGDKLYFSAYDGTNGYGLWQVDSTGQASLVQDINPGSENSFPDDFTKFGDKLYFNADDGTNGYELWQLDSTGQASLVQDINPGLRGSFLFGDFTKFGDKLYFSADDGTNGYELWQLDSTGQASLVQDINPGSENSFPDNFTKFGDKLYFSAYDGTNGYELWQLDSTGQASLVQDINPGSENSFPGNLIVVGDKLYFSADDGTGAKLWSIEAEASASNAPTVAKEISDQIALVGQSFSYQFANNTFDDADSDTLTYTASLANGQALPPWLAFDADTRTFSSTSIPNNTQEKIHQVKVTASDGTDSVSDIFNIVVANTYVILAGGGNDTVSGGTANDFLLGELGNDSLTGGAGNDVLIGGVGDDFLDGGTGIDQMIGDKGRDIFVLQPNDANNIIYDFSDGSDSLAIDPASFDSASTVAELFDGNGKDLTIAAGSADPLSSTVFYDDILLATVIGINNSNLDVNDFTDLTSL